MIFYLFLALSVAAYFIAQWDLNEQIRKINQALDAEDEQTNNGQSNELEKMTLASYYISSGIEIISYPMFIAATVFFDFCISYFVQYKLDMWYMSIAVFLVLYRIATQIVIKGSYLLKRRIDLVTPTILNNIKTAYAASTEDVAKAIRIGIEDTSAKIQNPILDFLKGIEEKGDPLELAAIAKLHFRNLTMRYLIDAIAEEKVQGGYFGQRIEQLHDEAERINEAEMQSRALTLDSSIAAYSISLLTLSLDVGLAIFKPEYMAFFKATPLGEAFMIGTVLMVGYTVILADSKGRMED